MYKQSINEIQDWLPSIDPDSVELASDISKSGNFSNAYTISKRIHSWAISVLEKEKLPTSPKEITAILNDYKNTSTEGCALHVVLEHEAIHASLKNNDANTAAIAGMKILDSLWQRAISKNKDANSVQNNNTDDSHSQSSIIQNSFETDENISLYQETINEMKSKYPNCNVNALRLLAATRLNVSKQQLDDLQISPE